MSDDDRVTVIAVTYSPGQHLSAFLDTLAVNSTPPDRVILADNGSTDGSVERADRDGRAELLRTGANLGFGAAANVGVMSATTRWVIVANPDITWDRDVIDALLGAAERWPNAGAIGPAIITPEGGVYPSARLIPTIGVGIGHALLGPVWPGNPWTRRYRNEALAPQERNTGWISGACMMLRRDAFDAVGGFDPGYFMYFEDVDLCDRLHRAGYDVVYAPTAVVTHDQGHAANREPSRMAAEHHRSAYRFIAARHRGFAGLPIRVASRAGLAARLFLTTRLHRFLRFAPATQPAESLQRGPTEGAA